MTTMYGLLDGTDGGVRVAFEPEAPRERAKVSPASQPLLPAARLRPCASVGEAVAIIDGLDRSLRKFELAVADSLQDYLGVNLVQIHDRALAFGWEPTGYQQDEGFRVYRYATMS